MVGQKFSIENRCKDIQMSYHKSKETKYIKFFFFFLSGTPRSKKEKTNDYDLIFYDIKISTNRLSYTLQKKQE